MDIWECFNINAKNMGKIIKSSKLDDLKWCFERHIISGKFTEENKFLCLHDWVSEFNHLVFEIKIFYAYTMHFYNSYKQNKQDEYKLLFFFYVKHFFYCLNNYDDMLKRFINDYFNLNIKDKNINDRIIKVLKQENLNINQIFICERSNNGDEIIKNLKSKENRNCIHTKDPFKTRLIHDEFMFCLSVCDVDEKIKTVEEDVQLLIEKKNLMYAYIINDYQQKLEAFLKKYNYKSLQDFLNNDVW